MAEDVEHAAPAEGERQQQTRRRGDQHVEGDGDKRGERPDGGDRASVMGLDRHRPYIEQEALAGPLGTVRTARLWIDGIRARLSTAALDARRGVEALARATSGAPAVFSFGRTVGATPCARAFAVKHCSSA